MRANLGPRQWALLSAVSEGLIGRGPGVGIMAGYLFDGELVGTNEIRGLARHGYVDTHLLGPPTITPDGWRVLMS